MKKQEANHEDLRYKKFTVLYQKTNRYLDTQFEDYNIVYHKTATTISLAAFIFPIVLSIFNFKATNLCIQSILILPILTYLASLVMFYFILSPKKLGRGISLNKIEEQFNKESIDILKEEIIANKLAFENNKSTIEQQNRLFLISITLILFSIGSLSIIALVGYML